MRLCPSCCYRDLEGTGKVNRKYLFNCFKDLRAVFVQEKKSRGSFLCLLFVSLKFNLLSYTCKTQVLVLNSAYRYILTNLENLKNPFLRP